MWSAAQSRRVVLLKALAIFKTIGGGLNPRLVIELGFVPGETWRTGVTAFISAGFSAWWFAADHSDAFRGWREAWPAAPPEAFHAQVERIAAHQPEVMAFFGNRVLHTLGGGQRMSPEEMAARISTGCPEK